METGSNWAIEQEKEEEEGECNANLLESRYAGMADNY